MKHKSVIYLIILIVVLLSAYLVYHNRNSFAGETVSSVYSVEAQTSIFAAKSRGDLLVQNREGITALNKNGSQKYMIIKQLTEPVMQNVGKYTLMYDRDGFELLVFKGGSSAFEFRSDNLIKLAKINSSGYVAIVSDDSGFKQKVQILNAKGEVIYIWQLGDSYITDIDITADGKTIIAATVLTDGEVATSRIVLIDINNESIIDETERENSLFMSVKCVKNSHVFVVGESEMLVFDRYGEKKWGLEYDERILQRFLIAPNGNPVLAFIGTRNNTDIEIYNNIGKRTGTYTSDAEIKAIDSESGVIAICERHDILLLSYNGQIKARKTIQKDAREIVLLSKQDVAVVGSSAIEIIKIR